MRFPWPLEVFVRGGVGSSQARDLLVVSIVVHGFSPWTTSFREGLIFRQVNDDAVIGDSVLTRVLLYESRRNADAIDADIRFGNLPLGRESS